MIFWIHALYGPEGYSASRMNELDRLAEQWVEDVDPEKNSPLSR